MAAEALDDSDFTSSGSPLVRLAGFLRDDPIIDELVHQDARLAEALVSYQMRLLGAMNGINHKIERVNRPTEDDENRSLGSKGTTGISQVDQMVEKLDLLEGGDKRLQAELEGVQAEFEAMSGRLKKGIVSRSWKGPKCSEDALAYLWDVEAENRPVIEDIFRSVATLRGVTPSGGRQKVFEREAEPDEIHVASDVVVLGPLTLVFGSGAIVAAAVSVIRRWRAQRGGTKKGRKVF